MVIDQALIPPKTLHALQKLSQQNTMLYVAHGQQLLFIISTQVTFYFTAKDLQPGESWATILEKKQLRPVSIPTQL